MIPSRALKTRSVRTWTKAKGEESAIYDLVIVDLLSDFAKDELASRVLEFVAMDARELRDRTKQFAIHAVRFCRTLPQTWEARRIGGQLLDSATSVYANYRAACRGRSRAEFVAKIGLVEEEADETLGWLELIEALGIARGRELTWLLREADELTAIFSASHKTAKAARM